MTAVHVYPLGDAIDHVTDGTDCPCGPTTEAVFREDGSNGWLVSHSVLASSVTPSRTDKQPRDSVAGAKGGQGTSDA